MCAQSQRDVARPGRAAALFVRHAGAAAGLTVQCSLGKEFRHKL